MHQFAAKLRTALLTRPNWTDGILTLREMIWLVPALGICVALSDTMQWSPVFDASTLRLALVAILIPSLGEELLFRVALLPKPEPETAMPKVRFAAALVLFVLWHPLQALFTTDARAAIFLDPWFLLAVAALGAACTRIYWASRSIWPAVFLHWLAVVGWKALAGGPELL